MISGEGKAVVGRCVCEITKRRHHRFVLDEPQGYRHPACQALRQIINVSVVSFATHRNNAVSSHPIRRAEKLSGSSQSYHRDGTRHIAIVRGCPKLELAMKLRYLPCPECPWPGHACPQTRNARYSGSFLDAHRMHS